MASPVSTERADAAAPRPPPIGASQDGNDATRDARYANPFAPPDELEAAGEARPRSLFGEILDWMLAPLLLLWPMSIAVTYLVAKSIANGPFDRALEADAYVLARQIQPVNGVAELSPARRHARFPARRQRRQRVLPGARHARRTGRRRPRHAAAARRRPPAARHRRISRRRAARQRHPRRVHDGRAAESRRAGARAGRRNARQAQPARQRHHQGRDPAAVRDPAARDRAGVVRAVARARAAARVAVEHPRAPPRRPVAARSRARRRRKSRRSSRRSTTCSRGSNRTWSFRSASSPMPRTR